MEYVMDFRGWVDSRRTRETNWMPSKISVTNRTFGIQASQSPWMSIRSSCFLFNKNQLFRQSLLTKISLSKISIHLPLAFTSNFYKCLIVWTLAFFCFYTLYLFFFADMIYWPLFTLFFSIASQYLNTIFIPCGPGFLLAAAKLLWGWFNTIARVCYQGYFSQVNILYIRI